MRIFSIFVNAAVNTNLGYPLLEQISGLDEDDDGVVDNAKNADLLDGLDLTDFCKVGDDCGSHHLPQGLGVIQGITMDKNVRLFFLQDMKTVKKQVHVLLEIPINMLRLEAVVVLKQYGGISILKHVHDQQEHIF